MTYNISETVVVLRKITGFLLVYFLITHLSLVNASAELPEFEDFLPIFEVISQEGEFDFARQQLEVEKLIDPRVDIEWAMNELGEIVERIKSIQTYTDTFDGKLDAITRYFYEEGYWNDYKKYSYDFSGYEQYWNSKIESEEDYSSGFVYRYLKTKKGQCFSMPMVVVIVGEKLGLKMNIASSPSHSFLIIKDPSDGVVYNYEATSGVLKSRSSYIEEHGVTETAIESGIYLRARSQKELLLDSLAYYGNSLFYFDRKDKLQTIRQIADEVLKHDPSHLEGILLSANVESMSGKLLLSELFGTRSSPMKVYNRLLEHPSSFQKRVVNLSPPSRKSLSLSKLSTVRTGMLNQVETGSASFLKLHPKKFPESSRGSFSANQTLSRYSQEALRQSKINRLLEHIKKNNALFRKAEDLGWNEQAEKPKDSEIEHAKKNLLEERSLDSRR